MPGHGPITDKSGVRALKRYLEFVRDESRERFDAEMDYEDATCDIVLDDLTCSARSRQTRPHPWALESAQYCGSDCIRTH